MNPLDFQPFPTSHFTLQTSAQRPALPIKLVVIVRRHDAAIFHCLAFQAKGDPGERQCFQPNLAAGGQIFLALELCVIILMNAGA